MARPRLPASQLSKWGAWKRGQREMRSKPGFVRHHKRAGTYGPPNDGNTTLMSRARHAAIHNMLRKRKK